MFYLRYIASELRRRKGRTVLTAAGLGVGVGLVVTVTALSAGLDRAQSEALEPLTGVGTDMSVSRPLIADEGDGGDQGFAIGGPPGAAPGGLSATEQRQLERENGGGRVGLDDLGKPGEHFEQDNFMTTDLSFPTAKAKQVGAVDGVEAVSGALTLSAMHISGKVPKESATTTEAPAPGAAPPGAVVVARPRRSTSTRRRSRGSTPRATRWRSSPRRRSPTATTSRARAATRRWSRFPTPTRTASRSATR